MIHECPIDAALNRLMGHFGSHLVLHPPASAMELGALEARVGTLPRDLVIFLATCNGLRLTLEGVPAHVGQLCWTARATDRPAAARHGMLEGLLALRGDPNGERDWLVTSPGAALGRVVRWDPWLPGATLLASSFGCYFAGWTAFLCEHFDHNGRAVSERVVFDACAATRCDEAWAAVRENEDVAGWLQELDSLALRGMQD